MGEDYLADLYARSRICVYRWGANPNHCGETRRNPLDRLKTNFSDLDAAGAADIVRDAADFLLEPLGCKAEASDQPELATDFLREVCWDAHLKMAKLHEAIKAKEPANRIGERVEIVKRMLDKTLILYSKSSDSCGEESPAT